MTAIITQENKETVAMVVNKIFLTDKCLHFFLFTITFFFIDINEITV